MARIRSVKPEIWKNEDLAALGYPSVIMFIGLLQHADMAGRGEDRPGRLKAEIFPYQNEDVRALMDGLEERKLITRYEVDGQAYYWVRKFREHQRITGKEAETGSKRPPAPDDHDVPRLPPRTSPTPPETPRGHGDDAPETNTGSTENLPEEPPGHTRETSEGFSGVLEGKGKDRTYAELADREESLPSDSSREEPSDLTEEEQWGRIEAFWKPAAKHGDPVVRALCRAAYAVPEFKRVVPRSMDTVEKVVQRLRSKAPHDAAILTEVEFFETYWSEAASGFGKGQWWLKFGKWAEKAYGKWATAKKRGGLMPVDGGVKSAAEIRAETEARVRAMGGRR
jgi:hypothetical protein